MQIRFVGIDLGKTTFHLVALSATGTDEKAHKITRADVAAFMVDQLASSTYLNQAVTIFTVDCACVECLDH